MLQIWPVGSPNSGNLAVGQAAALLASAQGPARINVATTCYAARFSDSQGALQAPWAISRQWTISWSPLI